jgi:TonB family protein
MVDATELLARELSAEAAKTIGNPTHPTGLIPDFVGVRFGLSRLGGESGESTAGRWRPPRFLSGSLPAQPANTPAGGEVLIELEVDTSGSVSETRVLRSTPPFTSLLREVVLDWRFDPGRTTAETGEESPITSRVLVAGWFRPPTLYSGTTAGAPPEAVREPSIDTAYPTSTATPVYPPDGRGDQVVLVEVESGENGAVLEARIVRSAAGFDSTALEAASHWRFRPAVRDGEAVPSFSYIVFGFREPVTVSKP